MQKKGRFMRIARLRELAHILGRKSGPAGFGRLPSKGNNCPSVSKIASLPRSSGQSVRSAEGPRSLVNE
jgi:hypothetical protein